MRAKRESSILDQMGSKTLNSPIMGQYASIMAKAIEKGKGGLFESRRATENIT